jgi:hypothetical protein
MKNKIETNCRITKDIRDKNIIDVLNDNQRLKLFATIGDFSKLSNQNLIDLHQFFILNTYHFPQVIYEILDIEKIDYLPWISEIKDRLLCGSITAFDLTFDSLDNIRMILYLTKQMNDNLVFIFEQFRKLNPKIFPEPVL